MSEITNEVLAERLSNLDNNNADAHKSLKTQIEAFILEHRESINENSKRISRLEFWKVGFVAKFSAYASIAIFCGSLLGTILVQFITKTYF